LQELAEHELNEMTSSVFKNFDLIKQNKVTVGGNDGWKIEFAGEDSFYLFEICTIAHGKIYILTYQDYSSKVPETLPLANNMVESFQIITEQTITKVVFYIMILLLYHILFPFPKFFNKFPYSSISVSNRGLPYC
jgi:hypothetical protein